MLSLHQEALKKDVRHLTSLVVKEVRNHYYVLKSLKFSCAWICNQSTRIRNSGKKLKMGETIIMTAKAPMPRWRSISLMMEEPLLWLDLLHGVGEAGHAEHVAAVGLLQRVVHRPGHHAHAASPPRGHALLGDGGPVDQHRRQADKEPEEVLEQDGEYHVCNDCHALQQAAESKHNDDVKLS